MLSLSNEQPHGMLEIAQRQLIFDRLPRLSGSFFECAGPATVIVTTANVEYNVRFETLLAGKQRHKDRPGTDQPES